LNKNSKILKEFRQVLTNGHSKVNFIHFAGNEGPQDRYEVFLDNVVSEGLRLPLVKDLGYGERSMQTKNFATYFNTNDKIEKAKIQANSKTTITKHEKR
jgi:hypothetical protein